LAGAELISFQRLTDDDDDTRVEAPAARQRRDGGRTQSSQPSHTSLPTATTAGGSGTVASPMDALRLDEIARTRRLLPVVLVITGAVAAALPLLGGDPTAKLVLYTGITVSAVSAVWLHLIGRDPDDYTDRRVAIAWTGPTVGIVTGVYFFGAFSPAPILMVLTIYLVSLGRNRATALWVWAVCAGAQAVITTLTMTGTVDDPGLLHANYLELSDQLIGQFLVQLVLAGTFLTARAARRASLEALTELERAVRGLAQREAMLMEVRQDMDRAMRIGGPGRFTDQVVGSYKLGVVIGRGAMGEVYDAEHIDGGEPAAVKLLLPSVVGKPGYLDRFLREVEATRKVNSPHIVRVLEVGGGESQLPYLAMERLHGFDMSHYMRTRRRLAKRKVLKLVREVGAGIESAGNAGIVHRDIKPHNLFLHEDGDKETWKILDFGVSKLGGQGGTLTQGRVVGTPGYMAPEQAEGKDVDSRADLYALAAITYRALTGHPPFPGKDAPTVLYNVVYKMPRRPSEIADLPVEVDDVLAIAIAKNADERFFTAFEFADALATALDGELDEPWRAKASALAVHTPWSD
jgi:serine/threonine-protein kinase